MIVLWFLAAVVVFYLRKLSVEKGISAKQAMPPPPPFKGNCFRSARPASPSAAHSGPTSRWWSCRLGENFLYFTELLR